MYVSMLMMHVDINNNINSIMLHADMIFFLYLGGRSTCICQHSIRSESQVIFRIRNKLKVKFVQL